MDAFYLTLVWLHITAAAVWIGGMVFIALVLVPATRQPEHRSIAASLIHWTGARFRWVGWVCLVLLVLTGFINLDQRGFEWADLWSKWLWEEPLVRVVGIKLFLVGLILLLSILHDFVIGPHATSLWQSNPTLPEAMRLRRQASWIGRINLLLALIAVALGVMLSRGSLW